MLVSWARLDMLIFLLVAKEPKGKKKYNNLGCHGLIFFLPRRRSVVCMSQKKWNPYVFTNTTHEVLIIIIIIKTVTCGTGGVTWRKHWRKDAVYKDSVTTCPYGCHTRNLLLYIYIALIFFIYIALILTGNTWDWKLEHSSTQSWRKWSGQKCVVHQLCCKSWINH